MAYLGSSNVNGSWAWDEWDFREVSVWLGFLSDVNRLCFGLVYEAGGSCMEQG